MALNVTEAVRLPQFSTRPEAARALGVCTKTLQRAEAAGEITPPRVGRSVYFHVSEVAKYAQSRSK